MVYRGKPSESCESCRLRRIKCDKKRPGCTQCHNIGIQCPGYRNILDLYFRDETSSVESKVKQSQNNPPVIRPQRSKPQRRAHSADPVETLFSRAITSEDDSTAWSIIQSQLSPIQKAPSQSIEAVAVTHLLTQYCIGSHFAYLPSLYSTIDLGKTLEISVQATALASLARELRQDALMENARAKYARALSMTNNALANPDEAVKDTTLIAVLLLSLFETFSWQGRGTPDSWTKHVEGAATLLRLRGVDQMKTELGRRLFIHVSNNLRVSNAQRAVPASRSVIELENQGIALYGSQDPHITFLTRLGPRLDEFADLRYKLDRSGFDDAIDLVTECQRQNDQMMTVEQTNHSVFPYSIVPPEQAPPWAFQKLVYQFDNHHAALHWNSLRMMRMYLCEWAFLACVEILGETDGDEHEVMREGWTRGSLQALQSTMLQTAQQKTLEICASAPQFTQGIRVNGRDHRQVAVAEGTLLWPLWAIGECRLSPAGVREYAKDRLRYIANNSRLGQAAAAADSLEKGTPEGWLHIYHLG